MSHSLERTPSSLDDEKLPVEPTSLEPTFVGKRSWYRSPLCQVNIGHAGLWNSMNSLGAGGGQEPWLANAANSIVFGLMVLTCLLGSSITSVTGYRWALCLGALGYAPYAGGLVLNLNTGATWLVYLGSITCGLSAGLFWSVEGAIALGYPDPSQRGIFLALWLAWRNAGQILGGSINLGLNAKGNKIGSISQVTYYVFIALQCVAPLVALFLVNPSRVQRKDRTPVRMERHVGFVTEMKEMWSLMCRREVLWLLPISLYAQWTSPYINSYLSLYFTVRARALGSLIIAILGVISNFLLGAFLDNTRFSKKARARGAYLIIMFTLGGVWIWATVIQLRFIENRPRLDWTDGARFSEAFGVYVLFYITYFTLQNALYWLIAQTARAPHELIRLSSFLRGAESAGSACGYALTASKNLPLTVPLGIDFGLWAVATTTAWMTVKEIGVPLGKNEEQGTVEKE
ncbi:DUF895 domain membrane protein [Rhodotorula diobovata]|uniref:DUF895 domain membrane protein n=1 Tax=Rhodotorula diobovata TaxID=5288 RepID=A0A5C5FUA3_9BASI|nr:DUF895 domain membrane protein [Rhodotorula diobovata]